MGWGSGSLAGTWLQGDSEAHKGLAGSCRRAGAGRSGLGAITLQSVTRNGQDARRLATVESVTDLGL